MIRMTRWSVSIQSSLTPPYGTLLQLDIALASVLSEAAQLRWRDILDAEDGAGLVYIERSKTDQAGEGPMWRSLQRRW